MAKKKKLSNEETLKCLRLWQEMQDQEAATVLIAANQGLVGFFIKRHLGKGLSYDELLSDGNAGLFNAICKFDYTNHDIEKFSSYIATAIENAMLMDLRSLNKHKDVLSLDAPIGQSKDGDELTIDDIVGTEAEEVINTAIDSMKIEMVRNALKCLTSRERQIILLRYGIDETHQKNQDELAEMFGCSRSLISRQEQKAIMKMRHPRNTRNLKDFAED